MTLSIQLMIMTTTISKLNAVACAIRSGHQLALAGDCWHCCKCLQVRRISHSGLRQWLGSPCVPDRSLCEAVVLGLARPSVVPPDAQVWVGGQLLHSSRFLAVYRGLYLCRRCGCYATLVPKLLKSGCQGVAAPDGRCVLTRISEGRLPPGLANWPADVEVESTDFIELWCGFGPLNNCGRRNPRPAVSEMCENVRQQPYLKIQVWNVFPATGALNSCMHTCPEKCARCTMVLHSVRVCVI